VSRGETIGLGPGGEFDAIRRMVDGWGARAQGIGDDAAVLQAIGDSSLVVSTDTSVEGVHFRREWLSPQEIGYRATAAALSDLAAMGAKPVGLLSVIALPEHWLKELDEIAVGIGEAASLCETPIIGGDLSRASELSITITVIGTASRPLLRSGARPGDLVYVTGSLGGPFAALRDFEAGREPSSEHRARFATPTPRIREAQWLSANGASAAIDISDGLAADARHIAAASGVCVQIDAGSVPIVPGITAAEAVRSGEEYELLITAPEELDANEFERLFSVAITRIGRVLEGNPTVELTLGGETLQAQEGYLHFQNERR
jgi:thiamine-monophosphate kinase